MADWGSSPATVFFFKDTLRHFKPLLRSQNQESDTSKCSQQFCRQLTFSREIGPSPSVIPATKTGILSRTPMLFKPLFSVRKPN